MIRAAAFCAALAAALAAPAPAPAEAPQGPAPSRAPGSREDPAGLARQAARDLAVALANLDQADQASDRVAALTQTIQAYEKGLSAFRVALRRAAIRQRAIALDFAAKRERIEKVLAAMMSIRPQSTPLMLLHPAGPLGTARSGIILADITPALQAEAQELRGRLQELAVLTGLQKSAQETLREGLRGLQQARTRLSQAISDRVDLPQRVIDDPAQLRALRASAETLDAFASGLTESKSTAPAGFSAQKGRLPLPLSGTVLRGFNEADAAGVRRPGILLAARPRALVTAPWASTIRYAGPLLNYANVMILEPAAGYLMVFAGLAEVYGKTGQVIPAGTPVGLMGGQDANLGAFLTQATEGSGARQSETLYIEIRVGKDPVNPSQWFAMNKE